VSGRRNGPSTVADIGEFPLIDRLAARLGPLRPDVVVGVGDDVAAMEIAPGRLQLVTCDVQVGGSHFLPGRCDPRRLGRKVAAINLSDIAAAGGQPTHFLCSLVLPPETGLDFLDALYDGLVEEASKWKADVVGGNVSRGQQMVIDLTLLGEVARADMLRRNGASAGELVAVTGQLGAAAAGLQLTLHPEIQVAPLARGRALDAFEVPTPRLTEGRVLVETGGVSAAIDVSDGLAADLSHLCDESGVGVRIDAVDVPVDEAAQAVARATGADPFTWAVGGGEDYELVFVAPPDRMDHLVDAVVSTTGTPVTVIGEIVTADRGRELAGPDGTRTKLKPEGWSHF
jgi:thiamine-monophosphate kinase